MKKTFKRFLSSALAAVMTASVLSVGMVTSASAAGKTYEFKASGVDVSVGAIDNFFTAVGATLTKQESGSQHTVVLKKNNASYITFTTTAKSSVSVSAASTGGTNDSEIDLCTVDGTKLTSIEKKIYHGTTPEEKKFTKVLEANQTYAISDSGSSRDTRLAAITVTEFSDSALNFTVSGTSNAQKGDVLVIDGNSVTVGDNGAWSFDKYSEPDPIPYTDGQELTVTSEKYFDTTVNVTYNNDHTYSGNITVEEKALRALPEGKYGASDIEAGLPNFEYEGQNGSFKLNANGFIRFILDKEVTVSIEYRAGNSGKKSNIKITDDSGATIYAAGKETTDNSNYYVLEKKLSAGTYKIVAATAEKTVQVNTIEVSTTDETPAISTRTDKAHVGVISNGKEFYAVSVISKADAEAATEGQKLYQTTTKGTELIPNGTDTVYKSLVLNGKTYTAKDFDKNASDADYVFATIVVNDEIAPDVYNRHDTVKNNVKTVLSEIK